MKKFTAFIMTLVIAICTTSFYAYANDDIEKDGAIETAINFLSLVILISNSIGIFLVRHILKASKLFSGI